MDEFDNIPRIKPKVSLEEIGARTQPVPGSDKPTPAANPPEPEIPALVKSPKEVTMNSGKTMRRSLKKPLLITGVFLALLIVFIVLPFVNIGLKGKKLYASAQNLSQAAKTQDIANIKGQMGGVKDSLTELKGSLKYVGWMKYLPWLGNYLKDADHAVNAGLYGIDTAEVTLNTLEPYADILGIGKASDDDGGKTTQDRIEFIVQSLPVVISKSDEIASKMALVEKELEQIDPNRYPEKIGDRKIREPLKNGLELFEQVSTYVTQGKPLLEAAPYLLGIDEPRTYLVLFQNDKELRPSGGFMTAYSIMTVNKAKFDPVRSDDIYNLDAKFKPKTKAPDPIVNYIKGPYIISKNIRLRDMNWSPDFSVNMEQFLPEAEDLDIGEVDGVIAVDTQVLVNLLDVIGEIGVSGFGNYSTKIVSQCNCPQVIYELESFADQEGPVVWDPNTGKIVFGPPNMDNRKKIIGPLMNAIMSNSMGQPKDKMPLLFEAGFKSLNEKHILFYMKDPEVQKAIESFGIGGNIRDYQGDYLHINDANLGGRKSNLYVTQEVEQDIQISKDGSVEKTLTLTYKNPEKQDGWLNSVLPSWVRIYVPKGSELIAIEGLEDQEEPYEEFDKTVFSGLYSLRPQGVSKVTVKYKLPFKVKDTYNMLIQKQPGINAPLYRTILGKSEEEFLLNMDREFKLKI